MKEPYYYWIQWGDGWGLWAELPWGGRVQVCKVRPCVGRWHAHFNGFNGKPRRDIGVFNTLEQAKGMCVVEVRF
jgi:hypothetical protein